MSEKTTELIDAAKNRDMDNCDRCENTAESKVAIAANYDDPAIQWRPLCNDCVAALGEWWRDKPDVEGEE